MTFSWVGLARAFALAAVPTTVASACATTDYEIASCDPSATDQDSDVCNRLNTDIPATECAIYQCDPATSRCVKHPRDFDRDGDPSTECGGRDCDDRNRLVGGGKPEICDGIDNDCNGIADDGVIGASGPPVDLFKVEQATPTSDPAIAGPLGGEALAEGDAARTSVGVYVGAGTPSGFCLKTSPLVAGDPPSTCAFLGTETSLAPRVPVVRSFGVGQAAVFVATNLCPPGALHYRFASPGQPAVAASIPCREAPAVKGAALPNTELFKDGTLAAVGYYDEPLPDLQSSGACAAISAAPAPLHVIGIASPTSTPTVQLPSAGRPLVLSEAARSRAPPSLARIDAASGDSNILVGSPDGAGASVWVLSKTAEPGPRLAASAATVIPGMEDARSVSLGIARTDAATRIVAVSDIGCSGQAVKASFGTVTTTPGQPVSITMSPAVDVVAAGGLDRFRPVVRWIGAEASGFWLVAWIETGGQVRARRYAADGKPLEEGISLASGATVIDIALDGRVLLFAPSGGANASAFQAVAIGCTSK